MVLPEKECTFLLGMHIPVMDENMNSPTANRRLREKDRYRQEILDAALDLFYRKGFQQTTVQEIADRAEFGVGTIYRLFPQGKDEIYQAWQETVVELWEEELAGAMSLAENRTAAVQSYIRAAANVYNKHPKAMAVYLHESAGPASDLARGLRPDLAERYRVCADKARQALEKGGAAGEFQAYRLRYGCRCLAVPYQRPVSAMA